MYVHTIAAQPSFSLLCLRFVVAATAAILVSYASRRWFETPFLRLKDRLPSRDPFPRRILKRNPLLSPQTRRRARPKLLVVRFQTKARSRRDEIAIGPRGREPARSVIPPNMLSRLPAEPLWSGATASRSRRSAALYEPRSATGFPVLRLVTGDIRMNRQPCGLHTSCILKKSTSLKRARPLARSLKSELWSGIDCEY
jgi:hypothetical protein